MEGGEERVATCGETVQNVEGVGEWQESYGEMNCGRVDWVAVERISLLYVRRE